MKHQLRALLRTQTEAAEAMIREAEGQVKELHSADQSTDPMTAARELDEAEGRLLLAGEFARGVHAVTDALAGELLGDPVPARERNEQAEYQFKRVD